MIDIAEHKRKVFMLDRHKHRKLHLEKMTILNFQKDLNARKAKVWTKQLALYYVLFKHVKRWLYPQR